VLPVGSLDRLTLRALDGREVAVAIATLSLGAAAIHFAVIPEHFEEYWLFGVFFAGLGWYQALWAVLYVLRPAPLLGLTALLVNAGTVALWVWTRTVGLPIGPEAGELEPAGALDLAATAFEIAIVVGLAGSLASARRLTESSAGSPVRAALLAAFVALVAGVTTVVLFVSTS
jgi:hypothetical protein